MDIDKIISHRKEGGNNYRMLNTYLKYSVNNPCLFDAKMFSTQEDREEPK